MVGNCGLTPFNMKAEVVLYVIRIEVKVVLYIIRTLFL